MQTRQHPLGPDSAGTCCSLQSLHYGTGNAPRKAYIQAALHADEIPGMLVAQHLRRRLEELELAGKILGEIVLVPAANPVGLAQNVQGQPLGRFDLATGINFNRGYRNLVPELKVRLEGKIGGDSALNVSLVRQTALQILGEWRTHGVVDDLKKCLQRLAIDADIVLDLHCDNEAVMHLYTGTALADQVAPLAGWLGAQAVLLATESGDEPFDESCGRVWWELQEHFGAVIPLACLAVTVELRGQTEVSDALAAQDADGIVRFLAQRGHLDLPAGQAPPASCVPTPLQGVEPLHAPHPGIVVFRKSPGDEIAVNELIAELIDPLTGERTEIRATVAGKLFARTAFRYVHSGMNLAKIAGAKAFRSGKLLSM